MRPPALGLATTALLLALTGCGSEGSKTSDPPPDPTESATSATSATTEPDAHPEFPASDYTYVLTQSCYCRFTVPVKITVTDGEVTDAVARKNGGAVRKGDPAPDLVRLTINDIIARINDADPARMTLDWPDSQDWPSRVRFDPIEAARDDEITYVLEKVKVG